MKKILYCNIPMKTNTEKCVYTSEDFSVPVSSTPVVYPINAFLEKTLVKGDEIKAVLLSKKDHNGSHITNTSLFVEELLAVTSKLDVKVEFKIIKTDFEQKQEVHDQLMIDIVDELEENAHIIADITYGPKDLPVVLFTALNFAEKFFNCEIDNIVYGQANFENGKPVNTKICDMIPLYYLNSVANTIQCDTAGRAKEMLKTLLSIWGEGNE